MKRLCNSLVGCLLSLSAGCSARAVPAVPPWPEPQTFEVRAKVTEYGVYRQLRPGRVMPRKDAATQQMIRNPTVEFVRTSTQIELQKGTYFGYRYWLKLPPDVYRPKLQRNLRHPEMTLPNGDRVRGSERILVKKATHGIVTALDLYAFTEDYELVEGLWTFQIAYEGTVLVEQRFTTSRP